jgi:hypothetical protein
MFDFSIKLLEGVCKVPTMHQQQSEQSCTAADVQQITLQRTYFSARHATATDGADAARLQP